MQLLEKIETQIIEQAIKNNRTEYLLCLNPRTDSLQYKIVEYMEKQSVSIQRTYHDLHFEEEIRLKIYESYERQYLELEQIYNQLKSCDLKTDLEKREVSSKAHMIYQNLYRLDMDKETISKLEILKKLILELHIPEHMMSLEDFIEDPIEWINMEKSLIEEKNIEVLFHYVKLHKMKHKVVNMDMVRVLLRNNLTKEQREFLNKIVMEENKKMFSYVQRAYLENKLNRNQIRTYIQTQRGPVLRLCELGDFTVEECKIIFEQMGLSSEAVYELVDVYQKRENFEKIEIEWYAYLDVPSIEKQDNTNMKIAQEVYCKVCNNEMTREDAIKLLLNPGVPILQISWLLCLSDEEKRYVLDNISCSDIDKQIITNHYFSSSENDDLMKEPFTFDRKYVKMKEAIHK